MMETTHLFDDIRPLHDHEVAETIASLLDDFYFSAQWSRLSNLSPGNSSRPAWVAVTQSMIFS